MSGPGELLAMLRHGRTLTRAQIVAESGLARATVAHRLELLLTAGYIVTAPDQLLTGGRPAAALTLNVAHGVLLVADVGVSHARFGVADLDGRLLDLRDVDVDVDDGPDAVLGVVRDGLGDLLDHTGRSPASVLAIGVGVPGPVDPASGRMTNPRTMRGWGGADVPAHFRALTSAPVAVDKDANIMALGVHRALGSAADDALVLKLGMGISAGIVNHGEIMRGARGAAGDLGHIPRAGGAPCWCGQKGCVEATAGGRALAARLRELGHPEVRSSADVVALARDRDADALDLLRRAGRCVGEVVAGAIGLLDPALIVVGGDLAEADEMLIAGLRERVYQLSHPLATHDLQIRTSPLGADAGLLGAAQLAADAALEPARVDALVRALA